MFELPEHFNVDVLYPADTPGLSSSELAMRFAMTASPSLGAMSKDKKKIVIIVDDLGRPTPAFVIIPHVLSALESRDADIRFLIATGSHRPLTTAEASLKLGSDIVNRYPVESHDAFNSSVVDLGNLANGFPCFVNRIVAEADLVIGIGCVLPHSCHGFGGGGKLFLPGVAGIESIAHLHGLTRKRGRAKAASSPGQWDMRSASEAFTSLLPPTFLINVVVNSRREIGEIFCGHYSEVYQAASTYAKQVYRTPIQRDRIPLYEAVIYNAYPMDADPVQSDKSRWVRSVFPNALLVHIDQAVDATDYHGWKQIRKRSGNLKHALAIMRGASYLPKKQPMLFGRVRRWVARKWVADFGFDYGSFLASRTQDAPRPMVTPEMTKNWFFSEYFKPEDFVRKYKRHCLFGDWNHLVDELRRRCPNGRIALLPCAPIQIPEIE